MYESCDASLSQWPSSYPNLGFPHAIIACDLANIHRATFLCFLFHGFPAAWYLKSECLNILANKAKILDKPQ